MPKIVEEYALNGTLGKIERLGLGPLMDEIRSALTGFALYVEEGRDKNSGAVVRELLDGRFDRVGGWTKKVAGDVRGRHQRYRLCLGGVHRRNRCHV